MTNTDVAGQIRQAAPLLRIGRISIPFLLAIAILFTGHGGLFRFGAATGLLWSAATLIVGVWFVRRPRLLGQMIVVYWPIVLLPSLAILSTAWSAAPASSLGEGIKMSLTVLFCFYFAAQLDTRQIMLALAIGMGAAVVLSVANMMVGFLQPVYELNGAFLGIFTQKTMLAKGVVWAAFALVALGAFHRMILLALIPAFAMFPLTEMAKSVTGEIGYLFVTILLVLLFLRQVPVGVRLMVPLIFAAGALAGLAAFVMTGGDLIGDLLALTGKNSTLTGRTVIWSIGIDTWSQAPMFGIGFDGFWNSPAFAQLNAYISANVDDGLQGFHNAYIETGVAFGLVGFVIFVGLILSTFAKLVRKFLQYRSIEAAIWLSAMLMITGLGMIEDSFLKPRSGHLVLFFLACIWARTSPKRPD